MDQNFFLIFQYREFKYCPVVYSSEGSITVGESVHVEISEVNGDDRSKTVLVSWSHKVSLSVLLINSKPMRSDYVLSVLL